MQLHYFLLDIGHRQFQTQAPANVKTFPMNTNFLPGNAFKNDKLFGV